MGFPWTGHNIEIIFRLLLITNIMIMLIPDTVETVVILLIRDGDKGEKCLHMFSANSAFVWILCV